MDEQVPRLWVRGCLGEEKEKCPLDNDNGQYVNLLTEKKKDILRQREKGFPSFFSVLSKNMEDQAELYFLFLLSS